MLVCKLLFDMVETTGLPLPRVKKIIPRLIVKWNCCKGRIDEMTRFLDEMMFVFRRGTPKQLLVMREIKKMVLSVGFSKKHCFPKKPIPKGKGYGAIMAHLWQIRESVKDVLHKLASTYKTKNPITGIIPGTPVKGSESADDDDEGI